MIMGGENKGKINLKVLLLEDLPRDIEIIHELLVDSGYDLNMDCTDKEKEFISMLRGREYDIILADFKLPGFDAFTALRWSKDICPDVPFICVSGTIGEETAVEVLKQGAIDYVLKDRMGRLPFAIKRALAEAKEMEKRKRAEEVVRESNRLLAEVQEITHLGGWEYNALTKRAHWTAEVYRIHGVGPEYDPSDVDRDIGFYAPEHAPVIEKAFRRAVELGEPYILEIELIRANGERIWVRTMGRPVIENDKVVRVSGNIMDITDRKLAEKTLRESEERYQTLARISPVGIFRTDAKGSTTYVNPMWCQISGLDATAALGEGWLSAVHPDDRKRLRDTWWETAQRHRSSYMDYRFLCPDGSVSWVLGQATPELNAEGVIVGYVGTITDISERKRSEQVIRTSLEEKEVLLKEVHHRVKNNLMTIIGLLKMEESKSQSASFNALMLGLEGRLHSMALVHESLHKSKSLARIDLQGYIETMAAHIRVQFGAKRGIHFKVQAEGIEADLDTAVPCGLILNELITNAFQHAFSSEKTRAGKGNPEITVTAKQENGACTLTVADNGVGLPRGVDLENPGSLGLGLVKMLSQQIQGAIEFDRTQGTTFRLRLKLMPQGG
jgi:PAS domain S-box-containing protein